MRPCPCGSGIAYAACCGPFHDGAPVPTPEALMRSRYSAYAMGLSDYVFRTWHPRTRPADLTLDPSLDWQGLEVLRALDDVVEFRARFTGPRGDGVIHETSRFEQRGGRWVYVDGEQHA
ncbi:MAG TPA: YchJ family metal-binding protein [Nocardioidaceae bacterium]|nr:YchJ family metal-binding protein [Nocardioidaceae bacterium]